MSDAITRRGFLEGTMGVGLGCAAVPTALSIAGARPGGHTRLHRIDCTQEYPADQYFAHGNVGVTQSAAGRYREAEPEPKSRFGYRFSIEHVGKPHVAVIRYPDDKRRFMCIMDGTSYDLTTGVFTDWAQPLSGKMLEIRQIFWPRWKDCSIVFMTWGEGEPAAVADIEIAELDDLPRLNVPGDRGAGRQVGIQFEDPAGSGATEGACHRNEWLDRVVQYARHTGQNLFVYPMAWYHGPLFPSDREPAGCFDVVVARDRKQYIRWTTQPEDWYAPMLERFAREGLEFQGALTLMRLGSLLQKMNIDLASIQAGEETFNNMLWNDNVQSSTGDWTPLYNVRNFNTIAEMLKTNPVIQPYGGALSELAFGERRNSANHAAPMFNPLHPVVQEAILAFVDEIGRRYGGYPAFKGISFNMFASSMPWFGSIHSGYDDTTIRQFEQETGITVPVDSKAPDRFSRRYEFLTYVCRSAWVAWRCRKIRELFGRIRHTLAAARSDLQVTITLWDETVVSNVLGGVSAALQLYARRNMLDPYRDAGIDPDLYGDEPGLEVDLAIGNTRDRGGHGTRPTGGVNRPVEETTMYRDFDFLDQDCLDAVKAHARPGAFIFNCWVEAWGKHVWFRPEKDDPNVAELAVMDGKPAEGIVRINSEYPADAFWWDSQLRITPAFPSGVHFLEPYAHAVAELDACRITRGGLFLDKAHSEAIRRFARAYRALPRRKFETVGTTTDPVAVRALVHEGRRYFYAINRDYYPMKIEIAFNQVPKELRDLAVGETMSAPERWPLVLGPYELRSFAVASGVELTGFTATPPPDFVRFITDETRSAFRAFDEVHATGKFVPGMDALEARMRSALGAGHLAWLRRALTSYVVRKCKALSG